MPHQPAHGESKPRNADHPPKSADALDRTLPHAARCEIDLAQRFVLGPLDLVDKNRIFASPLALSDD